MSFITVGDLGSEVQIVNITKENRMYETLTKDKGIRTVITPAL